MNDLPVYTIQSHPPRLWTGRCVNGEQLLLGPMLPNIVVYAFSSTGTLVERSPLKRPCEWDTTSSYSDSIEALVTRMNTLLNEFNASEATINVTAFFDEAQSIGILDLPSDYSAFLEDPSYVADEEEATDIRESIAEWKSESHFVLVWGAELWMDRQGRIIAT